MNLLEFKKRLNTHQLHFEDLVLLGKDGFDELNHKVDNFLSKKDNEIITTQKIDGAPAVICWSKFEGYPDNSISLKSFTSGPKNALSSVEQINDKYGDRPRMSEMLKYCLQIAKSIPFGEAWQGDCLFTSNSLSEREINGTKYLTFQPNKIIYSFEESSPSYGAIKSADFGICFHTIYKGSNSSISQSFDVHPERLNVPSNIYVLSPRLESSSRDTADTSKLESLYSKLKKLENSILSDAEYENLINNETFMKYWNTFENANLSDKRAITLDIKTFYSDLVNYVNSKLKTEFEKKLSTLKTEKGKDRARANYESSAEELNSILRNDKKLIILLAECLNTAAEIKMELYSILKSTKSPYSTFLKRKSTGSYESSEGEGISMSDSEGNIVKLVDRSKFSAANRDPDIEAGFEHESLDLSNLNEDLDEYSSFGDIDD